MPLEKKDSLKSDSKEPKLGKDAKNVEKVENKTTVDDMKKANEKKNAPEKGAQKTKYACGCPVVEIGDGRIKAKCIKHGVE